MELLSTRALNRALLARQMLLKREPAAVLHIIEHLCGLQAQQSRPPLTGLWSRLHSFQPSNLYQLLGSRQVLRATTLRGTLHLVTAQDLHAFRPLLQPMLSAGALSILRQRAETFDHSAVLDYAKACFAKGPRTFDALGAELIAQFPYADERAMRYWVRLHLPLASIADDDSAFEQVTSAGPAAEMHQFITRYLGAFGPATVADFQSWSGLKGVKPSFEAMDLLTFKDNKQRVLYDLLNAPRPDPDTPAPVRIIAEFDNLVLGHADRRRIVSDEHRPLIVTKNLLVRGTFLVDGFVAGTWKREGKKTILEPFNTLAPKIIKALETEALKRDDDLRA